MQDVQRLETCARCTFITTSLKQLFRPRTRTLFENVSYGPSFPSGSGRQRLCAAEARPPLSPPSKLGAQCGGPISLRQGPPSVA